MMFLRETYSKSYARADTLGPHISGSKPLEISSDLSFIRQTGNTEIVAPISSHIGLKETDTTLQTGLQITF